MQLRKTLIPVFGLALFAIGAVGFGVHAVMKGPPGPASALLPVAVNAVLIGWFLVRVRGRRDHFRTLNAISIAAITALLLAAIGEAVSLYWPLPAIPAGALLWGIGWAAAGLMVSVTIFLEDSPVPG